MTWDEEAFWESQRSLPDESESPTPAPLPKAPTPPPNAHDVAPWGEMFYDSAPSDSPKDGDQ